MKEHAGEGIPYRKRKKEIREVGYREDVDFKKVIGIWKSEDGSISKPTTRGRIHYDTKGGAHIVPIEPKE